MGINLVAFEGLFLPDEFVYHGMTDNFIEWTVEDTIAVLLFLESL